MSEEYQPSWEEVKAEMKIRFISGAKRNLRYLAGAIVTILVIALHTWFFHKMGMEEETATIFGVVSALVIWISIPLCVLWWYEDIIRDLKKQHFTRELEEAKNGKSAGN